MTLASFHQLGAVVALHAPFSVVFTDWLSIIATLGDGLALLSLLFSGFLSTAFLLGVLSGVGLIVLGWKGNKSLNLLVLDVLAIVCGLSAVLDLLTLMRFSDLSSGTVMNDAAAFSRDVAPILPGAVWAIVALLMLGAAVWYSLVRPLRRG